ncbi:hypothetical protein BKA93DRAFT_455249 [Sparassis latifolia]
MSSSHLIPPQEEKRDTAVQSRLPVDHTSFLDTPQEEGDVRYQKASADSFLVPPHEEKSTQTEGKPHLDKGIDVLEDNLNAGTLHVQESQARDEAARNKQISNAVRSGAAGVTGEDIGVAEHQRLF